MYLAMASPIPATLPGPSGQILVPHCKGRIAEKKKIVQAGLGPAAVLESAGPLKKRWRPAKDLGEPTAPAPFISDDQLRPMGDKKNDTPDDGMTEHPAPDDGAPLDPDDAAEERARKRLGL